MTAKLTEREGDLEITAELNIVGKDLLVIVSGGDLPHIGAVGLAEPRPSLDNPAVVSATSSVFTFLSHREDALAKDLAEELARRLNRRVVVAAGMHWDELKADGIAKVAAMCRRLGPAIAQAVTGGVDLRSEI